MINAGKYNKRIAIVEAIERIDEQGFRTVDKKIVCRPYAAVKTTRGMTLIQNGSDFEKAFTRFTIRFPRCEINRDMSIEYAGRVYTIEYLNNVNEEGIELEIQAKEVTH